VVHPYVVLLELDEGSVKVCPKDDQLVIIRYYSARTRGLSWLLRTREVLRYLVYTIELVLVQAKWRIIVVVAQNDNEGGTISYIEVTVGGE
jgi:hypothetical protein